jgi:hypothetical protein
MDIKEFREALKTEAMGQVFSVNLKNAIETKLIDEKPAKIIIKELKSIFIIKKKDDPSKPILDILEGAIEKLKLSNKCGEKYLSEYNPDPLDLGNYYNVTNIKWINKILDEEKKLKSSNVDDTDEIAQYSDEQENNKQKSESKIMDITTKQEHHWGNVSNELEHHRVWISNDDILWGINNDADAIRDRLGLFDHENNEELCVIKFKPNYVNRLYRPLVCDAGINKRFKKIHANDLETVKNRKWGKTADLRKIRNDETNISGSNEAVCLPFKIPKNTKISYIKLGKIRKGVEDTDEDHKKYIGKISYGDDIEQILSYIEDQIGGKIDEL